MTRSEAARKAGLARAAQFTSVSQRHARRYLTSEQAAANGRRGAQATISRYGPAFLFEKCRQYRLANPSRLELQMIGILSRMGINCSREYRIGESLFTLDFYLPDYGCGLEINGSIHDPGKPDYHLRLINEAQKRSLCAELDIPVLHLHHSEFGELRQVVAQVQQFINAQGKEVAR